MNTKIDNVITCRIPIRIPKTENRTDYLAKALGISKETAYKKIKGTSFFTLDDIIRLVSVGEPPSDESRSSTGQEIPETISALFNFDRNPQFDPHITFMGLMSICEKIKSSPYPEISESILVTDHLMTMSLINFDHLFKFYYYKWLYRMNPERQNFRLSDAVIPNDIDLLRKKIKANYKLIPAKENIIILDRDLIKNVLREIRFYYDAELIKRSELMLMQEELFEFTYMIEKLIKQPMIDPNHQCRIYLSSLKPEHSGIYCNRNDKEECHFWLFPGFYVSTESKEVCKAYKTWLNSLIRYSQLITDSVDAFRPEFINQSREYIRNLADKIHFYE